MCGSQGAAETVIVAAGAGLTDLVDLANLIRQGKRQLLGASCSDLAGAKMEDDGQW